jgi:hypothetical protein
MSPDITGIQQQQQLLSVQRGDSGTYVDIACLFAAVAVASRLFLQSTFSGSNVLQWYTAADQLPYLKP